MAALANSFVSAGDLRLPPLSGHSMKQSDQYRDLVSCRNLSFRSVHLRRVKTAAGRSGIAVRAGYSQDGGRPGGTNIFIGGFILGGIIVGALGCIYAPQISKALAGTDRKDLMRKLPKFIYDEEKALEKTRKILTEKIAQLNSAIDDVSSQLRTEYGPNGAAVTSDEVEATI
ncbi:hypothetical protein Taro_050348 [Colocasia esculenta]|uniref:Uncharacterized protein n=1 Tax=Colocasia esculenta TaxID=4460 RepID=A0A843XDQ1_COLES|nr:hypothetical protein [Colocasia esculenta]